MEAVIIRFPWANEIRCYKTVSYPKMLILPKIFFCTLQINSFVVTQQNIESINRYSIFIKYVFCFEFIYFIAN